MFMKRVNGKCQVKMNNRKTAFRFDGLLVLMVLFFWCGNTFFFRPQPCRAEDSSLRLPALFGDNMVLQRGTEIAIWGWSQPEEIIKISVAGQNQTAPVDQTGKWVVRLKPVTAPGPFDMTIEDSKHTRQIRNVVFGEVWLLCGQSNMMMRVSSSNYAEAEISQANYPLIRHFEVAFKVAQTPQEDCTGQWLTCTPEAVANNFSAVGYFFGRELHQALGSPIGLINCSRGGVPGEAFVRKDILQSDPQLKPIFERVEKWKKKRRTIKENTTSGLTLGGSKLRH